MGYGFREVTVDQPFAGKWTDVDMNLGGHGTFQGTKFSDRAGGFSYKALPSPKQIMQNRFIYWRVLNDMLELTETSMDTNLEDNQVRIIFRDSPIVSPVSIHETEESVIILVVTVSSVNRFVFTHPNKLYSDAAYLAKTKQASIFQQAMAKPLMNFRNFSLFDHGINVPLPIAAASHLMPQGSGYIFALSYESGSVTVYRLDKDDRLTLYDLRQANIFTKILSFTPAYLTGRGNSPSHEAVIGLNFFIAKIEKNKKSLLFLVALTANGHIRLYMCKNLKTLNEWSVFSDLVVDKRFANGYIDCNMILRRTYDNESAKEYPKFVVFVPGEGFKVFQTVRNDSTPPQLIFLNVDSIDFREKAIMDFTVTTKFLFILVSNPDEETDWEVKSYNLNDNLNPRFNLALLEPTARPDIMINSMNTEPKEFYFDLIFNKSSFSASTIYNALSMFQCASSYPKAENDWEATKFYALRVLESEIRSLASGTDEPLADDDIYEMNLKHWLEFYNSCVEYHVNTVKPLGIFYETNSHLVCIVKKSRVSFLRPTDSLETMFYFPHCVPVPDEPEPDDIASVERVALLKYLEIIDTIESTTDESHRFKIEKRIRENRRTYMSVWEEVANLLTEADPHSEVLERRHFIPMLTSKLRELGGYGEAAMRAAINCLCSWETEVESDAMIPVQEPDDSNIVMDDRGVVTENYMGSRLGANITYGILKQLLNHKYMIARNTLILQSIVSKFFSQNNQNEGIQMVTSFTDQQKAHATLLRCFTLLKMFDRSGEFIHDSWVENGLKVAHLFNCSTSDHLSHGKLTEFWPIRLIELFCHSNLGGMAIRSRVNQFTNSMVVAYADAAGRAIWASDESVERPFEEFLVAACQFNALSQYASELEICPDVGTDKCVLRKFYNAIADLFIRSAQDALGRLVTITPQQLLEAPYFSTKILDVEFGSEISSNAYFQKIINLFQIFGFTSGVQQIADIALTVSNQNQENWIGIVSVLGFKSALANGDYNSAYRFILRMPETSVGSNGEETVGNERQSSVRTFVTQILENGDIDVLVTLKTDDNFYNGTTMRDEIEKVLNSQAKLSDPLADDSVYQMVYFYHLGRHNFKKAAAAMLDRITKIGYKGRGRPALETQRDSYLDILSCMSLIEDEPPTIVGTNDPEDWLNMLRNAKITCKEPEAEVIMEDQDEELELLKRTSDPKWIALLETAGLVPKPKVSAPAPKDGEDEDPRLKSYQKILRECELCISLLMIPDDRDVEPIRLNDEKNRAENAILNLTMVHQYDQAVKLAEMWEISYIPIIHAFTKTCVNLVSEVLPASGDLADYVRHLDISELPNSNYTVPDMAFHALKLYIRKLEKPRETFLHKEATLVLLTYCMSLPRWLVDSYKKRDVSQLITCYTRFGDWEEATSLALETLDAALGRRNANDFDPSIQTVSVQPYLGVDPVIPYTAIENLANQMNARIDENPKLEELVETLRERCDNYVLRVIETREEMEIMYSTNQSLVNEEELMYARDGSFDNEEHVPQALEV